MFKINCKKPLPFKCNSRYTGIAFDGCAFYLTVNNECCIVKMDSCFNIVCCFDTCRVYSRICYDNCEKCFWAASDCSETTIYKLDECFNEIDCIKMNICPIYGKITGVSYNCCMDKIIISYTCYIISVDKCNPEKIDIVRQSKGEWTTSLLSVCPFYFTCCLKQNKKCIQIYSCWGELLKTISIPCNIMIEGAVFYPCENNDPFCHFKVLLTKNLHYSYILDVTLLYPDICLCLCPCNYDICNNPCPPDCSCCCKDCCAEILSSIALIETSIAHILNAEGEKLQKIISMEDVDYKALLCANKSVTDLMRTATMLETLLCTKLQIIEPCICCNDDAQCD